MKLYHISIITPSFNQGKYIEQTINSILDQNYPNLEYIIIDGGSTDNSIEIIKKYEKHLTYWISEPDKGQSDAINKGLKIATGDVVNWLNSDDYYEKSTIKFISEKFQDPTVKVVCAKSRLFNEKETVGNSPGTDWYPDNLEKTIGWARIDQPETFFRKSAFDKVGYLNTSLRYLMDREWWIRYLLIFGLDGIVDTEEILVNFRLHDTSKTVTAGKEFQKEHDAIFFSLADAFDLHTEKEMISKYFEITSGYSPPKWTEGERLVIKRVINYYFLLRGNELYYKRDNVKAREVLSLVDSTLLNTSEDNKLLKWLKIKNKFIPGVLKKYLNR